MRLLEEAASQIEGSGTPTEGIVFGETDLAEITLEDLTDVEEDELHDALEEWPELETLDDEVLLELVRTDKEPRGGMLSYHHSLARITLPSRRRAYVEFGDLTPLRVVAVAPPESTDRADMRVVQIAGPGMIDLPLECFGSDLFRIDALWTAAATREFIQTALTDHEADWMSQELIEAGAEARAEMTDALEQRLVDAAIDATEHKAALSELEAAPPWFMTLSEADISAVEHLPTSNDDEDPPLVHVFSEWRRPTPAIFTRRQEPWALQHICAAWFQGSFR
jgi:hypothetical protein